MKSSCSGHDLVIGDLSIEVIYKPIKNLHICLPPSGVVRISAPEAMSTEHVKAYAIGKLGWIRSQQAKFANQNRQSQSFVERESHYVWGSRVLLHIEEGNWPARIELQGNQLTLFVRPGTAIDKRKSILSAWYRKELKHEALGLIDLWQGKLGVQSNKLFIQMMSRKWGSCNPKTKNIRLNTQLALKPRACLDYVVLHELAHLKYPTHGKKFVALLNSMQPDWQERRNLLNELPILTT